MKIKNNYKKITGFIYTFFALVFAPIIAFAIPSISDCQTVTGGGLAKLFACFTGIAGSLSGFAIVLAFFFFAWHLAMYIKDYDSEDKRKDSREYMIYAIIAIFVLVSVLQLVNILQSTFGFSTEQPGMRGSTSTTGTGGGGSDVSCATPGSDPFTCIPTGER